MGRPGFATLTPVAGEASAEKSFFFYAASRQRRHVPRPRRVATVSLGQRRLFYEEEVSSQMWAVGQKTQTIARFFNFAYTDEFGR